MHIVSGNVIIIKRASVWYASKKEIVASPSLSGVMSVLCWLAINARISDIVSAVYGSDTSPVMRGSQMRAKLLMHRATATQISSKFVKIKKRITVIRKRVFLVLPGIWDAPTKIDTS